MVDEGVWWSKECGGAESEVGYVSVEGVGLLGHESLHTVATLSLSLPPLFLSTIVKPPSDIMLWIVGVKEG